MTLGEIEFNDIFLENNLEPFYIDVRIILFIFLFLMPIVLMNLLVRVTCYFGCSSSSSSSSNNNNNNNNNNDNRQKEDRWSNIRSITEREVFML